MAFYAYMDMPFVVFNRTTGLDETWKIRLRNEKATSDLEYKTAAGIVNGSVMLTEEFDNTIQTMMLPQIDFDIVDPIHAPTNVYSAWHFLYRPLTYGLLDRAEVVLINASAVVLAVFEYDKTRGGLNNKTFKMHVSGTFKSIRTPDDLLMHDSNGVHLNPLQLDTVFNEQYQRQYPASPYFLYEILNAVATQCGFSLDSSRPYGWDATGRYEFHDFYKHALSTPAVNGADLTDWDEIVNPTYQIADAFIGAQIQEIWVTVGDVLREIATMLQIGIGVTAYGEFFIKPLYKKTGFTSLNDVIEITFGGVEDYLGVSFVTRRGNDGFYDEVDAASWFWGFAGKVRYTVKRITGRRGRFMNLVTLEDSQSGVLEVEVGANYCFRQSVGFGADQTLFGVLRSGETSNWVKLIVPTSGSDEEFEGQGSVASMIYNRSRNGEVTVKTTGLYDMLTDPSFTFDFANEVGLTIDMVSRKVVRNLSEGTTEFTGWIMSENWVNKYPEPPTAVEVTAKTATTADIAWINPASPFSGVIVFMSQTTDFDFRPVDGTDYTNGNTYSDAKCITQGVITTASLTGLSDSTDTFIRVFAYNTINGSKLYNVSEYGQVSLTTLALNPTNHAGTFVVQSRSVSSVVLRITPSASGTLATGHLFVARVGAAPTVAVVDGTEPAVGDDTYTALQEWCAAKGAGTDVGGGVREYTVSVNYGGGALTPGTRLYFTVYPYRGSDSSINYKTDGTPLTGNAYILATQPAELAVTPTFDQHTETTVRVYNGDATPIVIVYRTTTTPTDVPVDSNSYSDGATLGSSKIWNVPAGSYATITSLTASTTYYWKAYPLNPTPATGYTADSGSGYPHNYETATPLSGTVVTSSAPVSAAITNLQASMAVAFKGSYTYNDPASGNCDGVLFQRKGGSSPTFTDPVNYTDYSGVADISSTSSNQIVIGDVAAGVEALADNALAKDATYTLRAIPYVNTPSGKLYGIAYLDTVTFTEGVDV